ncbi:transposase [Phormidium tenue FACHB-886]|nr:transposase [Phormidium tenue FACHB-886]
MTKQIAPPSPATDNWSFLDKSRRQRLEQSWAGTFRTHLLEQLPTTALAQLFADRGGRPRKDYQLVLGVLVLQQLHDLTDAETVEAISFNLSWHYALEIAPYSNPYLCERTLRNYRRVVMEHELEQILFR